MASLDLNSSVFGLALFAATIGFSSMRTPPTKPAPKSTVSTKSSSSAPPKLTLPVVEFMKFMNKDTDPVSYREECQRAAAAFREYGICVVRDPRVNEEHNNRFLTMLEQYFEGSDGVRDARPEYAYQVGVTPSGVERARNHCKRMGTYGEGNKPLSPCPPELDPKWRFFWRIGDTQAPEKTKYPLYNMDPVIPVEFPQWKETMDMWGNKMINAIHVLAEMVATGFEMDSDAFTSRLKFGTQLLAPTGSDFNKLGVEGTVLAGFHYDLNFMTIHGKSRFPGLYIWTRDGTKMSVAVPDGCLLVQAGKQMEYLTGGGVMAGFHEVVVNDATMETIARKKTSGESLWRVSSTLFSTISADVVLEPLAPFNADTEAIRNYPPIDAGAQVLAELEAINLAKANKA